MERRTQLFLQKQGYIYLEFEINYHTNKQITYQSAIRVIILNDLLPTIPTKFGILQNFFLFLKFLNFVLKASTSYLFWDFSFALILDYSCAQLVQIYSKVGYSFLVFMLVKNAFHVLGRPLSTIFTSSFSEIISSITCS